MTVRYRNILYAHDGSGFGHLQRMNRLATALSDACACLLITGTREAAWLVDESCEIVKLPGWDRMYRHASTPPDRALWLELAKDEVVRLRSQMIDRIVEAFAPDAVIVDHLPYGLRGELRDALERTRARKYLVTRGVLDGSDAAVRESLPSADVAALYDRILIAADRRITDALDDLPLGPDAYAKSVWIGYIAPPSSAAVPARLGDRPCVVCSAGSGLRGEALFAACLSVAAEQPAASFDLVLGPRGAAPSAADPPPNLRVSRARADLPALHRAADIVITSGGYNSLVEAMSGGAEIIVWPVNRGERDEQVRHARALQAHYPLALVGDPAELAARLRDALVRVGSGRRASAAIATGGTEHARALILRDLGLDPEAYPS